MSWKEKAMAKRAALLAGTKATWDLPQSSLLQYDTPPGDAKTIGMWLPATDMVITETPPLLLLDAIRRRHYTCHEVVLAFSRRASVAHQLTSCLSEINFDEALKRARELDAHYNTQHTTVGPLHGLPISVMDRFAVTGLDSSCGFTSWLGKPKTAEEEATLLRRLQGAGAVIIAKTNVPMSMMLGDTANNIVGLTRNPLNRNLSAGGACGGEGALLALRGSAIGICTDLAGSSRIPASYNGLYSLKTSEYRLPQGGVETISSKFAPTRTLQMPGLPILSGGLGLMSWDRNILRFVFESVLNTKPWMSDIDVLELPWSQEKYLAITNRVPSAPDAVDGRLVFGIIATDGHIQPHPTIGRALKTITEKLKANGHEVIEWIGPDSKDAVDTLVRFDFAPLFKIFGATAGKAIRSAIDKSGETPVEQLHAWYYDSGGQEEFATSEFWELCQQVQQYRLLYNDYWNASSLRTMSGRAVDGVIAPVTPSTATRPGKLHYFAYTAFLNVLNYPSATFPVIVGDSRLDDPQTRFTDADIPGQVSTEDINGMPACLQVFSRKNQEESVLALLEAVVYALGA